MGEEIYLALSRFCKEMCRGTREDDSVQMNSDN